MSERVETGPVEFEDDWTGVFIRGDNAFYYVAQLGAVLELMKEQWGDGYAMLQVTMENLRSLLASCNHHAENTNKQLMKTFEECKR